MLGDVVEAIDPGGHARGRHTLCDEARRFVHRHVGCDQGRELIRGQLAVGIVKLLRTLRIGAEEIQRPGSVERKLHGDVTDRGADEQRHFRKVALQNVLLRLRGQHDAVVTGPPV